MRRKGGSVATEPNRAADHPVDHRADQGTDRGDSLQLEPGIVPNATAMRGS
jgi:hypothetical protein